MLKVIRVKDFRCVTVRSIRKNFLTVYGHNIGEHMERS